MPTFDQSVIDAAKQQREVAITTFGRKSGKPSSKMIWIWTDGEHLYIAAGDNDTEGMSRDWPKNFLARDSGVLRIDGREVPVRPRHMMDPAEFPKMATLAKEKYGSEADVLDDPLTLAKLIFFELLPAE